MQMTLFENRIYPDGRSESTSEVSTNFFVWGLDLSGSLQGAGGVGGLLAEFKPNAGAVRYPFYDGNGNIADWIDADGTLVAHHEYDPYGNETTGNPPASFGFSTKPLDPILHLYYYGYRFYSPQWGRWVNRDPRYERAYQAQSSGGVMSAQYQWKEYLFTRNTPVIRYDYLGLASLRECWASKEKKCKEGCKNAKERYASDTPLGAVICFRGVKCKCLWPENAEKGGFEIPPGSRVAKCLDQHEESHMNDPRTPKCPSCCGDLGNTIMPPQDKNGGYVNTECSAYKASLECMNGATDDEKNDRNWQCYMKHIRKKMLENNCPNEDIPEPQPNEPTDC